MVTLRRLPSQTVTTGSTDPDRKRSSTLAPSVSRRARWQGSTLFSKAQCISRRKRIREMIQSFTGTLIGFSGWSGILLSLLLTIIIGGLVSLALHGVDSYPFTIRTHYILRGIVAEAKIFFPSSPYLRGRGSDDAMAGRRDPSSTETQMSEQEPFVGKYASIRKGLDYSYHDTYSADRQHFQDSIIDEMMENTRIQDFRGRTCSKPLDPWIVFTAGAMGAGNRTSFVT